MTHTREKKEEKQQLAFTQTRLPFFFRRGAKRKRSRTSLDLPTSSSFSPPAIETKTMDFLCGIKGDGFVLLCSDTAATQQIITIKHDEDKLIEIDEKILMGVSGEPGDRVQFSEYIAANVRLSALRNETRLSTSAVAHYARGELATALRRRPYSTNLLIAGFDEHEGKEGEASLFWMDYLATMHKMNVGGTGYGSYFVLSMLDRLWRPKLTVPEALEMMEKGVAEVLKRLVVAPPAYVIKIVDRDGIRVLKTIRTTESNGGGGGAGEQPGAAAAAPVAAPA